VPSAAVSWCVRKLMARGRPQLMFGFDGLPLIVPIDATLAALRSAVQLDGRYRLDPVDELRREVAGARSAYVRLEPPAEPTAARAKAILGQVELLLGVARGLLRAAEDASHATESNLDLIK
jgi:hypothetical protein